MLLNNNMKKTSFSLRVKEAASQSRTLKRTGIRRGSWGAANPQTHRF